MSLKLLLTVILSGILVGVLTVCSWWSLSLLLAIEIIDVLRLFGMLYLLSSLHPRLNNCGYS